MRDQVVIADSDVLELLNESVGEVASSLTNMHGRTDGVGDAVYSIDGSEGDKIERW